MYASKCRFSYREIGVGTGHPVIVLNQPTGIPANRNRAFVERLAAYHRVIFFDNRAILGSDRYAGTNILDTALDAINFIGTFGLGLVDLVEFSIDASVAQRIVHERPDLIRRVILVDTVSSGYQGIRNFPAGLRRGKSGASRGGTPLPRMNCFPRASDGGLTVQQPLEDAHENWIFEDCSDPHCAGAVRHRGSCGSAARL